MALSLLFKICVICLHTVKWLNCSIWPINGILTGTTTPGQSVAEINGNQEVLHIFQSSRTSAYQLQFSIIRRTLVLFDPWTEPKQILLIQVRVELGVRIKEWCLTIRWFRITSQTHVGGESLTPSVEIQSAYTIDPADWA